MNHVFEVSDEQYRAIERAANERGLAADDFFRSWVEAVRRHVEGEEVDPDQAWFWTEEWQAKEREADAAIAAGEGTFFESADDFLAALDER
jgi:hypothetical protein